MGDPCKSRHLYGVEVQCDLREGHDSVHEYQFKMPDGYRVVMWNDAEALRPTDKENRR